MDEGGEVPGGDLLREGRRRETALPLAQIADPRERRRRRLPVFLGQPVEQDALGPFRGQRARRRGAESPRRAGDHDPPSPERAHQAGSTPRSNQAVAKPR